MLCVCGVDHDGQALASVTGGRADHTWAQDDVAPAIPMHDAVEYLHRDCRETFDCLRRAFRSRSRHVRQHELMTRATINSLRNVFKINNRAMAVHNNHTCSNDGARVIMSLGWQTGCQTKLLKRVAGGVDFLSLWEDRNRHKPTKAGWERWCVSQVSARYNPDRGKVAAAIARSSE